MNAKFSEKLFWIFGATLFSLLLALTIGGVYTITPPKWSGGYSL
jgi:hypothetical protein